MAKPLRIKDDAKGRAQFRRFEALVTERDPDKKNSLLLRELRLIHQGIVETRRRLDYMMTHFMKETK